MIILQGMRPRPIINKDNSENSNHNDDSEDSLNHNYTPPSIFKITIKD